MAENWAEAAGKRVQQARNRNQRIVEAEKRKTARITELATQFWKSFQDTSEKAVENFNKQLDNNSERPVLHKEQDKIELDFNLEVLTVTLGGSGDRRDCLTVLRRASPLDNEGERKEYTFELNPPDNLWLNIEGKQFKATDAVKAILEPIFLSEIEGEE